MEKISEHLEKITPVELPSGNFVHKAEYLKILRVAIALSKTCDTIFIKSSATKITSWTETREGIRFLIEAGMLRAKEILEEDNG